MNDYEDTLIAAIDAKRAAERELLDDVCRYDESITRSTLTAYRAHIRRFTVRFFFEKGNY